MMLNFNKRDSTPLFLMMTVLQPTYNVSTYNYLHLQACLLLGDFLNNGPIMIGLEDFPFCALRSLKHFA